MEPNSLESKLLHPEPNGYMAGGLWFKDDPEKVDVVFCQLTGKECNMPADHDGSDCRKCNIPMVASILVLRKGIAGAIGANGRE